MDKRIFVLHGEREREALCNYARWLPDQPLVRATFELFKPNRSLAQNNLMWLWLTEIAQQYLLSHGRYFTPRAWKHDLQEALLGYEQIETRNGTVTQVKGTSKLTVEQFSEFLNKLEALVGSEFEIALPHPDDLYNEAMGRRHAKERI